MKSALAMANEKGWMAAAPPVEAWTWTGEDGVTGFWETEFWETEIWETEICGFCEFGICGFWFEPGREEARAVGLVPALGFSGELFVAGFLGFSGFP